jgi:phage protein D
VVVLAPAYRLTIGDRVVDITSEPRASTVTDLEVELAMEVPTDRFDLVLGRVGGLAPERGDEAVVMLGYAGADELVEVMRGTVDRVERGVTVTRITGLSAAAVLLRTFADSRFESKSAGEIVRALAEEAGVAVASADAGIRFPAYVVDGRRSLYHHMRELAALSGFDLYVDAGGELVFEPFATGNTVHVFEYGEHILELEVVHGPQRAGRVEAWGESPGASGGSESWAWLTKAFDALKGSAGTGAPTLLLERPALRTAEAARTAAEAAFTAMQRRSLRGRVLVLGRPQVKLGDAIRLHGVPDEESNGTFQVRAVRHRLNKRDGFVTAIGFRSID